MSFFIVFVLRFLFTFGYIKNKHLFRFHEIFRLVSWQLCRRLNWWWFSFLIFWLFPSICIFDWFVNFKTRVGSDIDCFFHFITFCCESSKCEKKVRQTIQIFQGFNIDFFLIHLYRVHHMFSLILYLRNLKNLHEICRLFWSVVNGFSFKSQNRF